MGFGTAGARIISVDPFDTSPAQKKVSRAAVDAAIKVVSIYASDKNAAVFLTTLSSKATVPSVLRAGVG
jgi:hypothetical protein